MSAVGPLGIKSVPRAANRAQVTYEHLRRAIVLGEIRPNERLVEIDLATALNVSRTPVRESLQRLAAEGLVSTARRGWFVREMTLDEVREIYEVRESLEGFAARQAALRASDAQRRKLVQMIKRRSLNPMGLDDRQVLVFNNDLFHRTIFRASGNGRLLREIVRTSEYYFNIRVASLYSDDEMAASARQHSELVQSIMARDGDRAEQTMRLHVREALAAIMRHSV